MSEGENKSKGCLSCKNFPCPISDAVVELYSENDLKNWYCVSYELFEAREWYCESCIDGVRCFIENVPSYATPKYCPFSRSCNTNWKQSTEKRQLNKLEAP